MKIRQYPLCGEYHAEPAQDFTRPIGIRPTHIVVPPTLHKDVVALFGRPKQEDFEEAPPPPPQSKTWSNSFTSQPLTRRAIVTTMWRMLDLPRLLVALHDEAVIQATAKVPGKRKHPREVVLAILQTTTCRTLTGRSIEKWAQRLRREGVVGHDKRVGWYLIEKGKHGN